MKAIQIVQPGEIRPVETASPALRAGEALLKIKYAGFCGSDLNTYLGRNPMATLPVIPGHEVGAEIAEVAGDAPAHLQPGLPCTVNPYTACGHCPSCRNGRPNACRFNQTLGVQRDGAMREFLAVPWTKVIADADISPRDFALVEPLSVGFHAVARAEVTDSDTVMVIGCGMIGIGAIVRAALRGAKVIATDVDDDKLALARRLGAAFTINSTTENVHERLQAITGSCGPDVVIEAVGAPVTYRTAVDEVAFSGRVVCIGYAKTEIAFETKHFVQKELDIRGSRNAMPEDFRAAMEYLKHGSCPKETLISGIYAPHQVAEAMKRWTADPGKVFRILIRFE
ncbi:MAG: zinc-binding alcohol dehydrogenase family protein [Tannerella sp.]|jgi:threonine dehydrogenase-like Zn-dependent dehydrogenase|nr:zinc-binding alcohol dehydrogenase family protein [Tannerella sp.]